MILLVHILIALTSIGISIYAAVSPTKATMTAGYAAIGATFVSGICLVFVSPGTLTQACISGVIFSVASLALVSIASARARTQAV